MYKSGIEIANVELDRLSQMISTAMRSRDLTLAGEYAHFFAVQRWGSQWYYPYSNVASPVLPSNPPVTLLTIPKLQHDIEQFHYLQSHGILGNEFVSIIQDYQNIIDRLKLLGNEQRVSLNEKDRITIGHAYNRIIHLRHTPKVLQALSDNWNATLVEQQYLNQPPGLVVIDNFLSDKALQELRLFCLESTVWSANRYAYGRLGAFFHDGFNCPLLLQIAEELREKLPRVIGDQYPLRQLWGFKNGHYLPGDSTIHADFAAVNVNFWITPNDSNLDEKTGGLVVYGVDAPLNWDFHTYNARSDIIKSFLIQQNASAVNIPYRQNRAVIFNSDLFHATAELQFRPGYENRRVNITMLYGERENDLHHRNLSGGPDPMNVFSLGSGGWRSDAFSRVRKRKP